MIHLAAVGRRGLLPSLLVVRKEAWLDGYLHVTRNGESAPVLRVNHAFAGVVLPTAGEWELEFRHRPRTWALSLRLATLGAGLLLATLLWTAIFRQQPAAVNPRHVSPSS